MVAVNIRAGNILNACFYRESLNMRLEVVLGLIVMLLLCLSAGDSATIFLEMINLCVVRNFNDFLKPWKGI